MKKLSLLILLLLGFTLSGMAQSELPKPKNPKAEYYNDYGPDAVGLGINEFQYHIYPQDVDGNPLDSAKLSFSVFTDFDEIYTFDAATYYDDHNVDFWADGVDRTELPYLIRDYDPFFTIWTAPFFQSNDPSLPAEERLFQWRIGLQVYYTDNGQRSASDIVYVEYQPDWGWPEGGGVFPKPVTLRGDVNDDGTVSVIDVVYMIDYLMGSDVTPFNKFNADADDNDKHSVADVTAIIDYLLSGSWD